MYPEVGSASLTECGGNKEKCIEAIEGLLYVKLINKMRSILSARLDLERDIKKSSKHSAISSLVGVVSLIVTFCLALPQLLQNPYLLTSIIVTIASFYYQLCSKYWIKWLSDRHNRCHETTLEEFNSKSRELKERLEKFPDTDVIRVYRRLKSIPSEEIDFRLYDVRSRMNSLSISELKNELIKILDEYVGRLVG